MILKSTYEPSLDLLELLQLDNHIKRRSYDLGHSIKLIVSNEKSYDIDDSATLIEPSRSNNEQISIRVSEFTPNIMYIFIRPSSIGRATKGLEGITNLEDALRLVNYMLEALGIPRLTKIPIIKSKHTVGKPYKLMKQERHTELDSITLSSTYILECPASDSKTALHQYLSTIQPIPFNGLECGYPVYSDINKPQKTVIRLRYTKPQHRSVTTEGLDHNYHQREASPRRQGEIFTVKAGGILHSQYNYSNNYSTKFRQQNEFVKDNYADKPSVRFSVKISGKGLSNLTGTKEGTKCNHYGYTDFSKLKAKLTEFENTFTAYHSDITFNRANLFKALREKFKDYSDKKIQELYSTLEFWSLGKIFTPYKFDDNGSYKRTKAGTKVPDPHIQQIRSDLQSLKLDICSPFDIEKLNRWNKARVQANGYNLHKPVLPDELTISLDEVLNQINMRDFSSQL